jgi:hypothetical protein
MFLPVEEFFYPIFKVMALFHFVSSINMQQKTFVALHVTGLGLILEYFITYCEDIGAFVFILTTT